MGNDKATAWLTLADADAVDTRVLSVLDRALFGYTGHSLDNQQRLGTALLDNYVVQTKLNGMTQYRMEDIIRNELCNHLRIDTHLDPHHMNLHIRLAYKSTSVSQQTINLRRY